MPVICKCCGKPLSTSIFKKKRTMKSCPACSNANGEYHVFHPYPSDFGTTPLRATEKNPDGPQSYCQSCRGENAPRKGTECKDVL